MRLAERHLVTIVMTWTVATTVFAWLPLVRIIARPEGYEWRILGVSGTGTSGPFWIFVALTLYAVTMFVARFRGRRLLFSAMLLAWHVAVTGVVIAGIIGSGGKARWEGGGLHFSLPFVVVVIPCILVTALVVIWIVRDLRGGERPAPTGWTFARARKAGVSLLLLLVALALFRAGTNYNWVTALAIITTVVHWILLTSALEPQERSAPSS